MSLTFQQIQASKRPLQSAQSRLALLSYLTQKKQGNSIYKKKTFFWDQEHLYSQNLTLRAQIKELTEANTRAKTRILEMQSQMKAKEIKDSEHGYKETVLRSFSLKNFTRKSLVLSRPQMEEETKSKTMRQIVRELREEIASLKNQNNTLKRTMKFTRMSELQALNTQMQIELQRLHSIANEAKNKYYTLAVEYENAKNALKRQSDAKRLIIQEKNKIQNEFYQLQREKQEGERKREMQERQFRQEIRKVRTINPENIYNKNKITIQQLNSIPRLEYSISGLDKIDGDTINFDKLINSDSELKSIPKIASITSIQLMQKQSSAKQDLSPQISNREKASEKMKTPEEQEANYEEDYEFEEDIQSQENAKQESLPLQTAEKEKHETEKEKHEIPQQSSEKHELPSESEEKEEPIQEEKEELLSVKSEKQQKTIPLDQKPKEELLAIKAKEKESSFEIEPQEKEESVALQQEAKDESLPIKTEKKVEPLAPHPQEKKEQKQNVSKTLISPEPAKHKQEIIEDVMEEEIKEDSGYEDLLEQLEADAE